MVNPANSTYAAIEKKVRRLTASASQSSLTSADIAQYVNTFYSQDFPYGIKIDQMRSIYTFYTTPYRDRYPLDVNYNQGVRSPFYVDGIQGSFFKDRQQFYNIWPKFPTFSQMGNTSLNGIITGISQPTNPTQITSVDHDLSTGSVVFLDNIGGMTELNGNFYTITVIDDNNFSLDGIDNSTFGAYTSGGTWSATSQTFSFLLPGPILSEEVTIGGIATTGGPITINDNGYGTLQLISDNSGIQSPNPIISIPNQNTNPAIPGMYNINTANPGLYNPLNIGTVNYVTGQIDFVLPAGISLNPGTLLNIHTNQYQTGLPYSLLFWNNEFVLRPIPKFTHKITIETYLTPVQFMQENDVPILNQWWQVIAIGAAIKVLEDRQDMDGVANLITLYDRQEDLVLERQGTEEIFQPNITIFNSTQYGFGYGSQGRGSW